VKGGDGKVPIWVGEDGGRYGVPEVPRVSEVMVVAFAVLLLLLVLVMFGKGR
jgi:hypothetical protein